MATPTGELTPEAFLLAKVRQEIGKLDSNLQGDINRQAASFRDTIKNGGDIALIAAALVGIEILAGEDNGS